MDGTAGESADSEAVLLLAAICCRKTYVGVTLDFTQRKRLAKVYRSERAPVIVADCASKIRLKRDRTRGEQLQTLLQWKLSHNH
jgi:hypothetical protein